MANEKELQVDDLETVATETVETKEKKVKAAPTAEDIAALVAGVEKIKEFDIFMLKEIPLKVFVSSKFKEAIEKNNLKGFNFKKVNVI